MDVYHILSASLSADGLLGCFQEETIMNKAVVNMLLFLLGMYLVV
jgi:hypothetical protein